MNSKWLPPLLSRITLATAFIVSGSGKFRHLSKDADYFRSLGIPAPGAMAPFVSGTEVACGSLLLLGLFTRAAAAPLVPIMAVAIATARRKDFHSFSDLTGVYEFSFILLLSYLMSEGAGAASMDRLIQDFREKKQISDHEQKAA